MQSTDPIRALLLDILQKSPREPAARLKQKLIAGCIANGLVAFDQKELGFRTFKEFLVAQNDLISIEEQVGGDILVSLAQHAKSENAAHTAEQPVLRGEIWAAFTNPDPKRERYYVRKTGQIIHYVRSNPPAGLNLCSDINFIPISPISAHDQSSWMRDFLGQIHADGRDVLPLDAFVEAPYSAALNAAFTRALGKRGIDWREFRTNRVIERVRSWANDNEIDFSALIAIDKPIDSGIAQRNIRTVMSPRVRAEHLLDSFSDAEIIETVIPILTATVLVKSRV